MFNIILFSPLEQFEPVPFLTIFLKGINFSVTSISIMCFYLIFIFSFLLKGSLLKSKNSLKFSKIMGKFSLFFTKYEVNGPALNYKTVRSFMGSPKWRVSSMSVSLLSLITKFRMKNMKSNWISSNYSGPCVFRDQGFFDFPHVRTVYMKREYLYRLSDVCLLSDFYKTFHCILTSSFNEQLGDRPWLLVSYVSAIKSPSANYFSQVKSSQSFHNISSSFLQSIYLNTFIPRANFFIFEGVYKMVLDMVKNTMGTDKKSVRFFPIVFTLFIFILVANIGGLVPYGSTITAYLVVTLTLSTMVMVGVTLYAFKENGFKFFGHFLPGGTPGWLIPVIIPIEILSFIFRVVSLAVRLFANMMAGHTLLAVIAGFGWSLFNYMGVHIYCIYVTVSSVIPVFVVLILVGLEMAVAIIQAYVFTILTCIYLEEASNKH